MNLVIIWYAVLFQEYLPMHWKIHIQSLALWTHFLFASRCWIQKDLQLLLLYFILSVVNICMILQFLLIQKLWLQCFLSLVSLGISLAVVLWKLFMFFCHKIIVCVIWCLLYSFNLLDGRFIRTSFNNLSNIFLCKFEICIHWRIFLLFSSLWFQDCKTLLCRWLTNAFKCVIWWENIAHNLWRIEASSWEASLKGLLVYFA